MRRSKVLDIYITEICNLNCEYCYVDLKKKEVGIKLGEFTKRVNLLDYDNIRFLGGEPLLKWDELSKIIELVNSKNVGITFTIITNGVLLNDKKLDFLRYHKVSVAVSLHNDVIKRFKEKSFLKLLLTYKDIIGFIILFQYNKEKLATNIFLFLSNIGFLNFSLSPITSHEWSNLDPLKRELFFILNHIKNNSHINISESDWLNLKNLKNGKFCTREQVDKDGNNRLCNRFDSESFLLDNNNISFIDKSFDKINSCNSCEDRWFCICPFGWYLDNFGNSLELSSGKILIFHKLNKLFINFYKNIVEIKNKNNFLTKGIEEIRFNLTNQCNLRCDYCYLKFDNDKLDISVGKNIIDYFLEQEGNTKTFSFFGGEPLLEYNLLKELVEYSIFTANKLNKKIYFKIATNLLLINGEIIEFLITNNFELHISFNGSKSINDLTRDNSYDLLMNKISLLKKYKYDFNKIVILNVLFPNFLEIIKDNILFFKNNGFLNINFEIYLGNKYIWASRDYFILSEEFKKIKELGLFDGLNIINMKSNISNVKFLDISTSGKISDNSLIFFNESIDFSPKVYLNNIFKNL